MRRLQRCRHKKQVPLPLNHVQLHLLKFLLYGNVYFQALQLHLLEVRRLQLSDRVHQEGKQLLFRVFQQNILQQEPYGFCH